MSVKIDLGLRSNVKHRSMKGKMATIRMKLGNIVEKGRGTRPSFIG